MTDSSTAYIEHVRDLNTRSGKLLRDDRDLLIHSGSEHHYFGDDRGINFQSFGHFLHWLPVNRPDQVELRSPSPAISPEGSATMGIAAHGRLRRAGGPASVPERHASRYPSSQRPLQ